MKFVTAEWKNLVMANYEVDPDVILPFLPKGTSFDTFQGQTFVSLVGFLFARTSVLGVRVPFFHTFEEINLRFYVTRREGGEVRRGVVFISERVPHRLIAGMANWLYNEHYTVSPTRHKWNNDLNKEIEYSWKQGEQWQSIRAVADPDEKEIAAGSMEEFIFEHYYGYTSLRDGETSEYRVGHPRWLVNNVESYEIKCDFGKMYGESFAHLTGSRPHSVMMAVGSPVYIDGKRRKIKC